METKKQAKPEELALAALAACYMDELSWIPSQEWARALARQKLIDFDCERMRTCLTALGEELIDEVMEVVYTEAPLSAATALLRALNVCEDRLHERETPEVQELIVAGHIELDEYGEELKLTENASARLYAKFWPWTEALRVHDPAVIGF